MRTNIGLAAAVLASGLVAQAFGAVSAPYTVAFDSTTDVADFIARPGKNDANGNADSWAVSGGAWNHSLSSSGSDSNGSGQMLETTGVSGANFTVSTDVTILARNLGGSRWNVQLPILSKDETQVYWSDDTFYTVGVNMAESWSGGSDVFRILSSDTDASYNPVVLASQNLGARLLVNGQYTMSVTGTYSEGSLTLSAVLKEGNTVLASIQALEATPKAGNYFGLSESTGYGSSGQASYDNFSITNAVPEPVSLSIVLLGGMGLMARRRKSA